MNRVCKNGKVYGYNVENGKLFDLNTFEYLEDECEKSVEKPIENTMKNVEKEIKESAAKFRTKLK